MGSLKDRQTPSAQIGMDSGLRSTYLLGNKQGYSRSNKKKLFFSYCVPVKILYSARLLFRFFVFLKAQSKICVEGITENLTARSIYGQKDCFVMNCFGSRFLIVNWYSCYSMSLLQGYGDCSDYISTENTSIIC